MKLKDKVAVVTGSASGMGKAIAKAALFLACDDSSWIDGAALNIDGGVVVG